MTNNHLSLLQAISANFERLGSNEALWAKGQSYTYADLESVACGIRDLLIECGVSKRDLIGVVTGDDLHTYASLLAVWSLNCAYVPLNIHNPPHRNEKIIRSASLQLVLTSLPEEKRNRCLPDNDGGLKVINSSAADTDRRGLDLPQVESSDLAYLFFTSGSTGTPKGVPITHGNLDAFMITVMNQMGYDFTPDDRFLQMFEMTFDLSVVSIFAPWYCGGCCCVVPDEGIAYMSIARVLTEQDITVAVMVPSLLGYLQRFFDEISIPSMRLNLFCGEALIHDMVSQWSKCVPNSRIENVYGPTEATIWFTYYEWEEARSAEESVNGIVPIGQPMPGCETAIVDDSGGGCAPGERGELTLIGPQVMSGYWQNQEKTAKAFIDVELDEGRSRAYRSGDIAFVNERGNIIYCGRLDSQVKIDGHRVELGEIEHCARDCIGSSKAAVILTEEPGGQATLHLFIAGQNVDIDALQQRLEGDLPAYMRPKHIRVLDDLPVNLNGKIDRPALAELLRVEAG
jgi:amino acid adenylation domain-containing protein